MQLPSAAHSYQLHQRLQRATPIDIISDDKGVIYSENCCWFPAKLFFTQDTSWGDALLYFVRLGGSSNSRPSDRGFLLKMTFMNCCLAFLSLVKINHVRGFCFTATSAVSTKSDLHLIFYRSFQGCDGLEVETVLLQDNKAIIEWIENI